MTEKNPELEVSNLSEDKRNHNRSREIIFGSFLFILGLLLLFVDDFQQWCEN